MATEPPKILEIDVNANERFSRIKAAFLCKFGRAPEFYARAPGRVNLIGEHIDYCGYAVLPMAIEQDIVTAVAENTSGIVNLANTNSVYPDYNVAVDKVVIDKSQPHWYYYFLCGFLGLKEHLGEVTCHGMDCLVDGTIPPSSGLSSSSAMVCCAGLATMHANHKSMSKVTLAEVCARCERYIGTEGGGMDQSISFLAEAGKAKLIEFNPLRASDVRLPGGAAFVITNSLAQMNKAASSHFNMRVVECRLATKVMAKTKGLAWRNITKLGELHEKLGLELPEMVRLVEETLHCEPYNRDEVCSLLGIASEELEASVLSENTRDANSFKLYQRAKHVFGEAARVQQFRRVCQEAQSGSDAEVMSRLGELMNDSHASCRDLYECSCPELDKLVECCLKSGAVGSRLTGAGWGGCAVSLVPVGEIEAFQLLLKERFYVEAPHSRLLAYNSMFATQPVMGAALYKEAL
ncbi:N-acetylgalactosamine kinase [Petromyzon marinus]|uniref:N-acetylgalactosamine kinase n=1 Tax=Petromyzon marinus TaxID=7757 RepID=A0AAJ7WQH3_PETMA|nr:N-acetylgalactosamine kinase [Petromyzon marinus]